MGTDPGQCGYANYSAPERVGSVRGVHEEHQGLPRWQQRTGGTVPCVLRRNHFCEESQAAHEQVEVPTGGAGHLLPESPQQRPAVYKR